MNEIENVVEELKKLLKYAEILKNPDEFFRHMQGHRTELSLVLSAFGIANMSKTIIEALEKQLEDRWVPVSEKLPEREDIYQVTIKYENFSGVYSTVRTATYKNKNWDIHGSQPMILNKSVIAWRPLSEPFKEVENE